MNSVSILHRTSWINDQDVMTWLGQEKSQTVLALVAEHQADQYVKQLQQVASAAGVQLLGAVFPELIFDGAFQKQGFLLISYPTMLPWTMITSVSKDNKVNAVTQALADTMSDLPEDYKPTLYFVFDAMISNIGTLLGDIFSEFGDAVNYAGVNAGSETFQPIKCIFDNKRYTGDAILAMVLPTARMAVLEHGYSAPEQTIVATAASGNRITSINWNSAFEVYAEQVKTHYGIDVTKDNFYENAVHFPFGIVRMANEILVRIPVALQDDGSLFCVGEVPENALLTLLQAEQADNKIAVDTLSREIKQQDYDEFLLFYCAGRRMHKQDSAIDEINKLEELLPDSKIVGALSLGEVGNAGVDGYPLFHNATLVSLPCN